RGASWLRVHGRPCETVACNAWEVTAHSCSKLGASGATSIRAQLTADVSKSVARLLRNRTVMSPRQTAQMLGPSSETTMCANARYPPTADTRYHRLSRKH